MKHKHLILIVATVVLLTSCGKLSGEYKPEFLYWLSYTSGEPTSTLPISQEFTVSFNSNGGSPVESQRVKEGEKITKPSNPTRTGYDFNLWECEGVAWDFDVDVVNKDITLNARWDIVTYEITYELNEGENDPLNPNTYTIVDSFELYNPIREGYSFDGWYSNSTKIESIQPGMYGDLILVAHWTASSYVVNATSEDTMKGSVTGDGVYEYASSVTITASPNPGYSFDGWYQDSIKVSSSNEYIFNMPAHNVSFEARFNIVTYSITYELDGGTNDSSNPSSYTVISDLELYDPNKTYHDFLGWYNGDTLVESITPGMYGDLTLTAHWKIYQFEINAISAATSKGTTLGSGTYDYNSAATITAEPKSGWLFKGWYRDAECKEFISGSSSYTFKVPLSNVTYYADFWSQSEKDAWDKDHGSITTKSSDSKHIFYGMYPQTRVSNASLISKLETMPQINSFCYCMYDDEYYYKYKATPFGSDYTFSDGTLIKSGTSYWFKVEPVEWRVLENADGEYLIFTESILVNHRYSSGPELGTAEKTDYQGNTATVYCNNYKYSEVRSWLNTSFYDQLFFLDDDNVAVSFVDNSPSSTKTSTNPYACEDTYDKLFLLSYKDKNNTNYGLYGTSGSAALNDYSKAHGSYQSVVSETDSRLFSAHLTRSPLNSDSSALWYVKPNGGLYSGSISICDSRFSVRPMMHLVLDE